MKRCKHCGIQKPLDALYGDTAARDGHRPECSRRRAVAAPSGGKRPARLASLHVDHCHDSGRIRGLLCLNCNQGIGKLGEDPERLRRAAEYLAGTR